MRLRVPIDALTQEIQFPLAPFEELLALRQFLGLPLHGAVQALNFLSQAGTLEVVAELCDVADIDEGIWTGLNKSG